MKTTTDVDLEAAAREVKALHEQYEAGQRTTLAIAIKIGERLCAVKASMPHGKFGAWIEANCAFSHKTATFYMRASDTSKFTSGKKSPIDESNNEPQQQAAPTTITAAVRRKPATKTPPTAKAVSAAPRAVPAPPPPPRYRWHEGCELLPAGMPFKASDIRVGCQRRERVERILGRALPGRFETFTADDPLLAQIQQAAWRVQHQEDPAVLQAEIAKARAAVPDDMRARFDRELARALTLATADQHQSMDAEVERRVDERCAFIRARVQQKEDELEDFAARLRRRAQGGEFMSEAEYKLILGCLHPDSNAEPARRNRAFDVFRKLLGPGILSRAANGKED